jgi:hypothetical protein
MGAILNTTFPNLALLKTRWRACHLKISARPYQGDMDEKSDFI